MENLTKILNQMKTQEFDVVTSRGSLSLQQTQRNKIKAEILQAIYEDVKIALEEEGFNVCITSYGPVIEVHNEKVEENVFRMEYRNWLAKGNSGDMKKFLKEETVMASGFISIQLDAVMKNLDTNAELDEESYLHELEQKELRAKEKEKKKREKIERDAEIRAEKARRREEEMARLQRERE